MVKTITTGYCKVCKKDVENPIKKPLDTTQKISWGIACFATLGIGLVVYLPYRFRIVKKKFCPVCYTMLKFPDSKEETKEAVPEFDTSTAKGRILEKVEKVKAKPKPKKEEEKQFCQYCGEQVSPTDSVCKSCNTKINR